VATAGMPRPSGAQSAMAIAAGLCYLVGYPVAIVAHSAVGWVFVTVGGAFLLALGVITIRRVHRGTQS
jgi:hypothetical protein